MQRCQEEEAEGSGGRDAMPKPLAELGEHRRLGRPGHGKCGALEHDCRSIGDRGQCGRVGGRARLDLRARGEPRYDERAYRDRQNRPDSFSAAEDGVAHRFVND